MAKTSTAPTPRTPLYYRLWRWHFFAGLFCVPLVILLAITGSIYLFKPQIQAALEARYDNLTISGPALSADEIVARAEAGLPGASVTSYQLPSAPDNAPDDAIRLGLMSADGPMLAFVHPTSGEVLGSVLEKDQFFEVVKTIHGELLMGDAGSLMVELAASWAFVMLATGLYLWWPRGTGLKGVLLIRTGQGKRLFWRDLHAVTGIWVSGAALVLLLTGLPWTNVWGDGFKLVRDITGTAAVQQDWSQSRTSELMTGEAQAANPARQHDHSEHGDHSHHAKATDGSGQNPMPHANWQVVVTQARALDFATPVKITAPSAQKQVFVVRSASPNPAQRQTAELSVTSANVLGVAGFGDRHVIDQAVGIGIALHEGTLFGWLNQLLGLLTALGLIILSVSSVMMWWARRPQGSLGAPPFPADHKLGPGLIGLVIGFGLFLPVLAMSIIVIAMLDRLVWPVAKRALKLA